MAVHLACDVGGTFTDLFVSDDGQVKLFKAPTTPDDPVKGLLFALSLASQALGCDRQSLLGQADTLIHATTRAINAVLTGRTARTAFVVTKGHRDILLLREGGRLNPYDNTVPFPKPYVPRRLTYEVAERIDAAGSIVLPLDDVQLERLAGELGGAGIEAVGVCLLWATANPVHELRVGEVLARRLPDVAITLSHRLNPIIREYRRASSACIDASLKPIMGPYLRELGRRLAEEGFRGRLLMVTSQGGVMDVADAAEAPIHGLMSGPSLAPVAGRHFAREDLGGSDVIVADTGGTSFDVSLVRAGTIPFTSETWLGPRFSGHMTGFPSVDVKSIGAGGGSIAWVDDGGLLHVGPDSAGSVPGPVCYGQGGKDPTVTDCALLLGYLDPARFLGGRVVLDRTAAERAVSETLARALGVSVQQAAGAVLDVLTQSMAGAIEEITVSQGIDASGAVLVAGGGAAGFNAVRLARRLGCRGTLFPSPGAALSAAGALLSDIVFSDGRVRYLRSDAPDLAPVAATLAELASRARSLIATTPHAGQSRVEYWAECRYPQQTWEIPVPLPERGGEAILDLDRLVSDFHQAHDTLYAVSDRRSPIEVIAWRMRVSLDPRGAGHLPAFDGGPHETRVGMRPVYLDGEGWTNLDVYGFDEVRRAEALRGPAIIETAFTTILIPSGAVACPTAAGSILVHEELRP
jgi:N-methylhydantoinase A